MLVASMNPCPCGLRGTRDADCRCDDAVVSKYVAKLSGPLLDRIDLQIEVNRISYAELADATPAEPSGAMRARVVAARERQRARYKTIGIESNARLAPGQLRKFCALDDAGAGLLRDACQARRLSARAFDRIARVARTIADLAESSTISREHVAEAIRYRSLERLGTRRVA
jgi:magnesium chelatase family protein